MDSKPTAPDSYLPLKVNHQKSGNFVYTTALFACLIAFSAGISFSWTSPAIPKLNGSIDPEDNPLASPLTPGEESWIASLLTLGAAMGPLLGGQAADKIGRKRTLLMLALPMIISLLISAYATSVTVFYFARVLMGLGSGSVFAVLPMYLGEIAEDHNRGRLGCLMGVFVSSGLLFSYLVGPFMTVRNFCLVCLSPLVLFLPIFGLIMPESPQFLASINNKMDLFASLGQLRGRSHQMVEKEANFLLEIAQKQRENKATFADLFKNRAVRTGLIISGGLVSLQQFAGINAVLSYMQSIFDATGSGMAPETSTMIVGTVQVLTTILTSAIVDLLGRRILLLVSALGSALSLITLGVYFHLKSINFEVGSLSWLPVASLLVFIVCFNLGFGPLPWAVMAELFPANVKSNAATLMTSFCFVCGFVITLGFPPLSVLLGMAQSFWIFSGFCVVGFVFVYWKVPETKGRTLQEIQEILGGQQK